MQLIPTKQFLNTSDELILGASPIQSTLDYELLSPNELIEWKGFKNEQRKAEYLTTRHLFHFLVEKYFSETQINKVELRKEELGKPYAMVNDEHVFVSFAHTKTHVFAVLSKSLDIGLDAEQIGRDIHPRLLQRILNEDEIILKQQCKPIQLWTAKEAAVKRLGTGLRTNLDDITLKKCSENEFLVRINDENSFQICSFHELNHQISIAY